MDRKEGGEKEMQQEQQQEKGGGGGGGGGDGEEEKQTLIIPGLPNDVARLCLACLPFSHHARLKCVSRSWRSALSSRSLFDIRSQWGKGEDLLCVFPEDPSLSPGGLFDPRRCVWSPIHPMPCDPSRYGLSNFGCVALGPTVYVLGGSLFDARTFPMDRPTPSSAVFCYDLVRLSWAPRSPMLTPRGSFACGACGGSTIVVAGGGSRHAQFGVGGSRVSAVERYDSRSDVWEAEKGLPEVRAGCTGFVLGDDFWVMGGYGLYRTVSGVFPVDDYYRDGAVLGLESGQWREILPMWEEGERSRLGQVVVLRKGGDDGASASWAIFMLDGCFIFRFDAVSNKWLKESTLPKKVPSNLSCGFAALNGQLHVMMPSTSHHQKSYTMKLIIQVYNPRKRSWRFLHTKPPFQNPLDFKCAAMCTIHL
ncbi:F-box/kelch-repeat protein OR23 isoform X2 [Amborella trichopoda]|uniref:F-box/kelch-repeat protein OR23 isoform X2 n=1 Tax=Amborella trichopoda TaxID=13333 RepID=UPI0005D46733|nr:F-box/kelch-repeat protein OR23 isoform X2 [Amborella trichopoda]|eukprot:XP_011622772.1 F-box/kelch-repeat protein OR23 isoform X2 [Amborella trichopoda]